MCWGGAYEVARHFQFELSQSLVTCYIATDAIPTKMVLWLGAYAAENWFKSLNCSSVIGN
jgi:hypothetical protein